MKKYLSFSAFIFIIIFVYACNDEERINYNKDFQVKDLLTNVNVEDSLSMYDILAAYVGNDSQNDTIVGCNTIEFLTTTSDTKYCKIIYITNLGLKKHYIQFEYFSISDEVIAKEIKCRNCDNSCEVEVNIIQSTEDCVSDTACEEDDDCEKYTESKSNFI